MLRGYWLSHKGCWVFGFGVLVSGFWFQGFGFRVLVSGSLIQGLGFRVFDSGSWFQGLSSGVPRFRVEIEQINKF
jgi:hypothetical protein